MVKQLLAAKIYLLFTKMSRMIVLLKSNVIANAVQIAGHVTIDNMAIIGGLVRHPPICAY